MEIGCEPKSIALTSIYARIVEVLWGPNGEKQNFIDWSAKKERSKNNPEEMHPSVCVL